MRAVAAVATATLLASTGRAAMAPRGLPLAPTSKVCVLGGGLQGCATAYYLKQRGFDDVTIVERTEVAAAASGKGGGFLAGGWGSGPTKALHEKSFDLHAQLAKDLNLESYRKIKTLSVTGELGLREWPPREKASSLPKTPDSPAWLDAEDTGARLMDPGTAQVVPAELCKKLFEASGAKLVVGAARGLEMDEDACVGVNVEGAATVPCDAVVCAMGVWSVLLEDWLGEATGLQVPLEGVYSSSVVFKGDAAVAEDPCALFCAEDSNGCHLEVYPRVDGSVYLCGIGGSDHVRGARLREGGDLQDATMMKANPSRVAAAVASFSGMAPFARGQAPAVEQACMRPCAPDALPVLGVVPGTSNVVCAYGHNCWGILWAPVTGLIMSELLADGKVSAIPSLDPFSPARFMRRAAKRGRARGDAERVGEQW